MLPKINDLPIYDVTIPSSGKTVRHRPYLVKEEKVLLTAIESKDKATTLKAIADTVLSCIKEDVDPNSLTLYDVEYLFAKIRAKSVGEKADIRLKCRKCEHSNDVQVDIDNLQIEDKPQKVKVDITDDIAVEMVQPSYLKMLSNDIIVNAKQRHERLIEVILESMTTMYTPDSRINLKEEPKEELIEFIESLNEQQFNKVKEFVDDAPKITYEIDFQCVSCNHENHISIEDEKDFF